MRIACAVIALSCLTLAAPVSARDNQISWGKAGVSFDQYRDDASTCGHVAWYEDVSNTNAAKAFKRATSWLDANEAGMTSNTPAQALDIALQSARVVESTRPEVRMREVRDLQYDVLGQCLTELGYVRFQLTDAQQAKLRKLRTGTPERHRYLHSLGSNRRVLEAQRV